MNKLINYSIIGKETKSLYRRLINLEGNMGVMST